MQNYYVKGYGRVLMSVSRKYEVEVKMIIEIQDSKLTCKEICMFMYIFPFEVPAIFSYLCSRCFYFRNQIGSKKFNDMYCRSFNISDIKEE